ncbi:type 4a pilus biogenesis protein PilO [Bergeriella denitrificans]|uniref:Pilus assembly protein n=1 Tax=Bergeriella denitrificans TaxID=494 RepID=A0A378UGE5_BERDE|nr:type 4a pilus biogenesis protein PilO [Bergeriella denitrificans]STZ75522.1 pilus assembly protein [Bergeriella denitrificans]
MSSVKLRNADLKDLYLLDMPAKLLLAALSVAAIMAFGYAALFRFQLDDLSALKEQEAQLRQTYARKSMEAAALDSLQAELNATRSAFDTLLRQLPTDAEIPNLIQELHLAASQNGLRLDSVTPLPPAADGAVQKLPYNVVLSGPFDRLHQFVRDVGGLSRIITLDSLNITRQAPADNPSGLLTLSATATTYQARAEAETAGGQDTNPTD